MALPGIEESSYLAYSINCGNRSMGARMLFLDDARIIACVGQAIWDDIIILDHLLLYTLVCLCVHGDNSGQLKRPAPATGSPLPLL